MLAVAGGAELDETFEEMMWFCLQCRACEAACPSLVPFGRAMEGARAEISAQRSSKAHRLRHFVLGRLLASRSFVAVATILAALAQRLRLAVVLPESVGGGIRGLRRLSFRPDSVVGMSYSAIGGKVGTAALLAGCVMDPWFGDVHRATIELLRRCGYRVVVPATQTCCGALAAHDGAADAARRLARRNARAFSDVDLVVTNSAGCGAHLREYGTWAGDEGARVAAKTYDVDEVVAKAISEGRLPRLGSQGAPVAFQDACHLRHAQRVTTEPRDIVEAAGYEVRELDPDGLCCGAAGIYSLLQPAASAELGRRKAEQVERSGALVVASANPGCEIQLRRHLADGYRIAHPVELYWVALSGRRVEERREQEVG
jgi:glycolate oxidase iron-sulfur subunit